MSECRILYATPTYGHPRIPYLLSQRAVERSCRSASFRTQDFMLAQGFVQDARNSIVQIAIEQDYDYVLMHDDDLDVSPEPNPIDLLRDALEAEGAAAAGAVYLRDQPVLPIVHMLHPEYADWAPVPHLCLAAKGFKDEPRQVDAIGSGFMLLSVPAMRAFRELDPGPPFRIPCVQDRFGRWTRYTEDVDFCLRLRRHGFTIVADPRPRTVHYKERGALAWDRESWEADLDIDVRPMPMTACRLLTIDGLICVDTTPPPEGT